MNRRKRRDVEQKIRKSYKQVNRYLLEEYIKALRMSNVDFVKKEDEILTTNDELAKQIYDKTVTKVKRELTLYEGDVEKIKIAKRLSQNIMDNKKAQEGDVEPKIE
jgi:hypothetical protein